MQMNLVLVLLILFILAIAILFYINTKVPTTSVSSHTSSLPITIATLSNSTSQQSMVAYAGDGTNTSAGNLPTCPPGTTYLTSSPINASQLDWIEPLGHMGGTAHILPSQGDHLGFAHLGFSHLSSNNSTLLTPVYSPGNVTLLQVAVTKGNDPNQPTIGYVLFFSPCKSVMFGFQMTSISSLVQNVISRIAPYKCGNSSQQSLCVYANLGIQLKAGDRLGSISIDSGLDFAAADVRTPTLGFIDKNMATGFLTDSYTHAVCPLDYFINETKTYLYSKMIARNSSSNGIPVCGTTMQDLAGTAQGNWYRKSGGVQQQGDLNISSLLAIVHLNVDHNFGMISAGVALFQNYSGGAQILFSPQSSGQINREPSQVTPDGKVYCYQGPIGSGGKLYLNGTVKPNSGSPVHIDIRLDNATVLETDYASSPCATIPVLTNPAVYVR